MPHTPPAAISQTSLPGHLAALSRDVLFEQLDAVLKRLEPLSQTPPKVLQERALWFHRHEYGDVNAMWKRDGIDAIVSRYKDARTFAAGMPVSLNNAPSATMKEAPEDALVLLVSEFGPNPQPDPAQQDYFRSSHIPLPERIQSEVLDTFRQSGLLARVLPQIDDQTQVTLEGAPITEAGCGTEWYGCDNYYGDGNTLVFSLTLSPLGHESERLILSIDRGGEIQRKLWYEPFVETGYEGHAHAIVPLTEGELRVLIPIVAKIADLPPHDHREFQFGMWLGNSLPRPDETARSLARPGAAHS